MIFSKNRRPLFRIMLESSLPVDAQPRYKLRMTEIAQNPAVAAADIDAAARVVAPFAVRTPLLSFPVLNERVGTKVFLKPEMLQRTGSFKFRGAFNKLASIPQSARSGGVVAFSSGNHAQGVAAAAVEARAHQGLWRRGRAL